MKKKSNTLPYGSPSNIMSPKCLLPSKQKGTSGTECEGNVREYKQHVQEVFQFLQVNLQFLFCFLPLQPEEYKQYAQCWASPHLP